jgi:DNA repair exonuclease SbcCD ATPase subunit
MQKIEELKKCAQEAAISLSNAKAVLKRARAENVAATEEYDNADEAQQVVQAVAETIQEEAHDRIAGVVTKCLSTVFDEPYTFKISFERARGRTEAKLLFVRDEMEVNPIDASGGGVIDVAAFALRISCLMLSRPARRRVMVLDEPFKFVSADRRGNVRAMLEDLAAELGIQFIVVTHFNEYKVGKIVEVG